MATEEAKGPPRRPSGVPYSEDPDIAYEERLSDWLAERYSARQHVRLTQERFDHAEKELAAARARHAMVMSVPMPTRDAAA